jgi:F-type H+-transporting ATPase subunit b
MELVTPGLGLIFWTSFLFLVVLFLLSRFAWKPIVTALHEREQSIADALNAAQKAKDDMASLTAKNQELLKEAQTEREKIMKEAKAVADKMIAEAKERATVESNRIIAAAQEAIRNEKQSALAEVKTQVATLSLLIAEKLIRKNLQSDDSQIALVQTFLKETKLN